ncbi:HupE/UreJ family protein [Halomonas sp. PR-M31]|uniref:HupE/UreJ family protein n=1 Tax=Halomonas sp. PR-M31 TaxID=1471202 RepID=UPI00065052CB|nr:HupE/UreJ family protein [Halomonas sp. PR-M31]
MSHHRSRCIALSLAPLLLLGAGSALAHPGHIGPHAGFLQGFLHPLLGLDHLLAMLAVGVWGVMQGGYQRRFTPLMVLGGMWLGAGLAWAGMNLTGVETGIALSVLLVGILIATFTHLSRALGTMLVVGFMLFHGAAHASELPAGASVLMYLIGFSVATLGIAYGGKALGGFLKTRSSLWSRALGGAIAFIGGLFLLS